MLFLYYKPKIFLAFLGVFGRMEGDMNDEQFSQVVAWLNALKEENHRLNGQIKHLTTIVEAMGLHTANMKKDAETTRFRVGALCLFMIVIPIILPLALCTAGVGYTAAKAAANDAPPAKVEKARR